MSPEQPFLDPAGRRQRAAEHRKEFGFDPCGACGKPVIARPGTLKRDGYHWHESCWIAFRNGHLEPKKPGGDR